MSNWRDHHGGGEGGGAVSRAEKHSQEDHVSDLEVLNPATSNSACCLEGLGRPRVKTEYRARLACCYRATAF